MIQFLPCSVSKVEIDVADDKFYPDPDALE